MSQKIVTKKFGMVSIPEETEDLTRQDFQKQKANFFKNRFIRKNSSGISANRKFSSGTDNFRSNWFCKTCHQIFHLQPRRKNKTLLEFDLKCQHCKSKDIIRGAKLSEAIRNGIPASEINELFSHDNWEMELSLTDKSKYYLMVE